MSIIITCGVLHEMGVGRPCCGSCHEDADEGYYNGWMLQSEPPMRNGRESRVFSDTCCTQDAIDNWTRDDWARAVWTLRRLKRRH